MYKLVVFKIPNVKLDIEKHKKNNLILSSSVNYPLFSLGFHSFLHRTKNAMSITNKIKSSSKFYYVVNPFEHMVSNYEKDLKNLTIKYFNIKGDAPNILSRAFYKMWEILYLFDIAEKDKMVCASLAEGPGAFIQAIIEFRRKLGKGTKNDNFFGVTIHPEEGNFISMGKQFMNYYKKKYPGLVTIHKTYAKKTADKYTSRDNGDLTQVKTISLFKKDIAKTKKFADLVTADGGFQWKDENFQEQEAFQLILGEIIGALRVQAKNGHFVLKLFETFTYVTLKMLYILTSFYENSFIYKPFFSRSSNSEKYIICKNFKFDQKKDVKILDEKIKVLEDVLEKMSTNKYVTEIFPDLKLSTEFVSRFRYINVKIMNKQQIMINKIVKYIKDNNYFGEKYNNYRNDQINATEWWNKNFYPSDKSMIKKNKDELNKILKKQIDFNISEETVLNNKLVTN